MASITFDQVIKKFGDVVAVNDLNLEVADKEFMILVGPAGCGKSTALRCLAGLEDISSGRILIGNKVVNDVAPVNRDIAMVFPTDALDPDLTVFDNIAFAVKWRKVPKDEIKRRVNETCQILGIEALLSRKPRQLSGGQRNRVSLARAIVCEPKVFIFDEPLSSLDPKLRVETRANYSKLHQRLATTFVYAAHDQVEAMTMATRIAVMNRGILQQVDTPQNLYARPGNLFVAGYIGSPAMNFFSVKLDKADGKLVVDGGTFRVEVPADRYGSYSRYEGRSVILGIRPEDIHDPHFCPPGIYAQPVEGKVDVAELMGNENNLYISTGQHAFTARVDPRTTARMGDRTQVVFDMNHTHLFDSDTERAIR